MKKLWKFGKFHHHQLSIQEVGFITEFAVLETLQFLAFRGKEISVSLDRPCALSSWSGHYIRNRSLWHLLPRRIRISH